jgi:pyruvate kinase
MRRDRLTKIVATLGPASSSPAAIQALIRAGLDVARLNFSHGDRDTHLRVAQHVRAASKRAGREVAILADLCGPKIRLGTFEEGEELELAAGSKLTLTSRAGAGRPDRLSVSHRGLARDLCKGRRVLLADGRILLEVLSTRGEDVRCRVVEGGAIRERAGVNLPDSEVTTRNPTAKDLRDLETAIELGADWVALSFVQGAADVQRLKRRMAKLGSALPVIAKIEKPQAIEALGAILDAADGAMVARGDLGVECPPEDVPLLQKHAIREAHRRALPVITATQMLESMITESRPTRAEASDVANAILDGTDAVMLSAETAVGRHPIAAVEMMARIARRVERSNEWRLSTHAPRDEAVSLGDVTEAVSLAARQAAEHAQAAAILVVSESGESARRLARQRPGVPLVVFTPELRVERRLQLVHGLAVHPLPREPTTDELIAAGLQAVAARELVPRGALVVVVAGGNPLLGASNMVKLSRVP